MKPVNFICFEHKTKGLIFLDKAKIYLLSLKKHFVYGVLMPNFSIYGHNAWKHKNKSKK
jgi:hypothetical protein